MRPLALTVDVAPVGADRHAAWGRKPGLPLLAALAVRDPARTRAAVEARAADAAAGPQGLDDLPRGRVAPHVHEGVRALVDEVEVQPVGADGGVAEAVDAAPRGGARAKQRAGPVGWRIGVRGGQARGLAGKLGERPGRGCVRPIRSQRLRRWTRSSRPRPRPSLWHRACACGAVSPTAAAQGKLRPTGLIETTRSERRGAAALFVADHHLAHRRRRLGRRPRLPRPTSSDTREEAAISPRREARWP